MSSLSKGTKRMLVVLALVVMGSGFSFLTPDKASAQFGRWYEITWDGVKRGAVWCGVTDYYASGSYDNYEITCQAEDYRADNFWVYVIPQYYNGYEWKPVPGFQNRLCTNKGGGGTTKTCWNYVTGEGNIKVRIRGGLVNRYTKKVVKSWVSPYSWIP